MIQDLVKDVVKVVSINEGKKALNIRVDYAREKLGVFVFHTDLARGIDIKLEEDAHVLIIGRKRGIKWSVVLQMVGRGCRSLGIATGTYFTYLPASSAVLETVLKRLETDYKNGVQILRMVYDCWHLLNSSQKTEVHQAIAGMKWATTLIDLEKNHGFAYKILCEDAQRAASSA